MVQIFISKNLHLLIQSGTATSSRGLDCSTKLVFVSRPGGLFGSMGHSPQVAHSGINHHLDDHECYVGDRGYHNGQQWAETQQS